MRVAKTLRYDVGLTWAGGRAAIATAGERPALAMAPPADFPGGDASQWSPEHLFLASLSSCTLLSFLAHATNAEIDVRAYEADVSGTITRRERDGRYAFVELRLAPRVVVAAGQAEAANALTPKAERDCFISATSTAPVLVDWQISEE